MALRIYNELAPDTQMAPAQEPAMPEEMPMAPPEDMTTMMGGTIPPAIAVYRTPDLGPFMCGNCTYFQDENSCELVAGTIEPEGVCNLFTAKELGEEELTPLEPEAAPIKAPPGGAPLQSF